MQCPFCKTDNSFSASRCSLCDAPLSRILTLYTETGGESDQEALYKACIGEKNQAYYLHYFSRFDREARVSPSWNASAFFMTLYWLMYRKMVRVAALYFMCPFIVSFVMNLCVAVFPALFVVWKMLTILMSFGVTTIVIPLYANALYYWECKERIRKVQSACVTHSEQCRQLTVKGGTSMQFVVMAIIGMWFVSMILAWMLFPQYRKILQQGWDKKSFGELPPHVQRVLEF